MSCFDHFLCANLHMDRLIQKSVMVIKTSYTPLNGPWRSFSMRSQIYCMTDLAGEHTLQHVMLSYMESPNAIFLWMCIKNGKN